MQRIWTSQNIFLVSSSVGVLSQPDFKTNYKVTITKIILKLIEISINRMNRNRLIYI